MVRRDGALNSHIRDKESERVRVSGDYESINSRPGHQQIHCKHSQKSLSRSKFTMDRSEADLSLLTLDL
jgi:hypothetical protein